jgi:hypothetical protein
MTTLLHWGQMNHLPYSPQLTFFLFPKLKIKVCVRGGQGKYEKISYHQKHPKECNHHQEINLEEFQRYFQLLKEKCNKCIEFYAVIKKLS